MKEWPEMQRNEESRGWWWRGPVEQRWLTECRTSWCLGSVFLCCMIRLFQFHFEKEQSLRKVSLVTQWGVFVSLSSFWTAMTQLWAGAGGVIDTGMYIGKVMRFTRKRPHASFTWLVFFLPKRCNKSISRKIEDNYVKHKTRDREPWSWAFYCSYQERSSAINKDY